MQQSAYDAWVTRDPYDGEPDILMPGDIGYPHCSCGAFLRRAPHHVEGRCFYEHCLGHGPITAAGLAHLMGCGACRKLFECRDWWETNCGDERDHQPHLFPGYGWDEEHRICKRCGKDSVNVA